MTILSLFRRTPRRERPVAAVAAANAILGSARRIGSETDAPRLQRLVMLCDRACIARTGRRLVEERPVVFADMPFHETVHVAFRRWNTDPIDGYGLFRGLNVDLPHVAEIDAARLAVIDEVVAALAPIPTFRIPRVGDDALPCTRADRNEDGRPSSEYGEDTSRCTARGIAAQASSLKAITAPVFAKGPCRHDDDTSAPSPARSALGR